MAQQNQVVKQWLDTHLNAVQGKDNLVIGTPYFIYNQQQQRLIDRKAFAYISHHRGSLIFRAVQGQPQYAIRDSPDYIYYLAGNLVEVPANLFQGGKRRTRKHKKRTYRRRR